MEQRAILAHGNTVLFITHCGINSIVEAVYHRYGEVATIDSIWLLKYPES